MQIIPAHVIAQAARDTALTISGEVKTPLVLTVAMIEAMKKDSIVIRDKSNKEHTYKGVDLYTLLKNAGVTLGEDLKGRNLTKYILTQARDGYQVVFSLAEIDPDISENKIIVATRKDGVLLPINEWPFHIIIKRELRQSRFIRQVVSIKVKYADQ